MINNIISFLPLFIQGLWKMKWWLLPIVLLFLLWALYEAIEDKWDNRNK